MLGSSAADTWLADVAISDRRLSSQDAAARRCRRLPLPESASFFDENGQSACPRLADRRGHPASGLNGDESADRGGVNNDLPDPRVFRQKEPTAPPGTRPSL